MVKFIFLSIKTTFILHEVGGGVNKLQISNKTFWTSPII